ncbi:MAG: Trm112 family protein [Terriglobales bacterium]|jgi:uncharacterized protein
MKVDSIASPAVNDGPVVGNGQNGGCVRPRRLDRSYNVSAMIPQDLLEMLVCPVCKEPVLLTQNGTGLKCGKCLRVYPIQDDIPIMLIDAATVDPH